MGFKENLITDWEDKTIEYQGKNFYIVKQFVYNKQEYLYGCDINTINNENLEVIFLKKVKDDIFEHIDDNELFEQLLMYVTGEFVSDKIKEIYNKVTKK